MAKVAASECPFELDDLYSGADKLEEDGEVRAAFRLFLKGAEAGDTLGQLRVGACYASGSGVRKDPAAGRRWDLRAYRLGDSTAASKIGNRYGNEGKLDQALAWAIRALNTGDAAANFEIGVLQLQMPNREAAIPYLKKFLKLKPPCGATDEEWLDSRWILRKLRAVHLDKRYWRYDERDRLFDRFYEHWKKGNIERAVRLYRESARLGQWLAQWSMGHFYAVSNGGRAAQGPFTGSAGSIG